MKLEDYDVISKLTTSKTAAKKASDYIEGRMNGTIRSKRTPWQKFNDAHIDGIEECKVYTWAGMSGSGKTAISSQLERELHQLNPGEDFAILSFNFEMPSMSIVLRNVTAKYGLSSRELLSASNMKLPSKTFDSIKMYLQNDVSKLEIYYVEYPKTIAHYNYIIRAFAHKVKKPFVVIADHSILFQKDSSEKDLQDTLMALSKTAITLKKEVPVTQIFLSQMNRDIEKPERRLKKSPLNFPIKGDIYGSDALFMCSDSVMISHRPHLLDYPKDSYGIPGLPTGKTDVFWHFIKLRDFEPHVAHMRGDFANMKIYDA